MVEINPKYRQLIEAHVRKNAPNSYEEDMTRIAWLLLAIAQLALWIYIGTLKKFSPKIMSDLKVFMVFVVSCSLVMLDVVQVQHRAKCDEKTGKGEEHWIVTMIKSQAPAYNKHMALIGAIMWTYIYWAQIAPYTANPLVHVTMTGQWIADLLGDKAFTSARDNDTMDEIVKGLLCRIFISFVIWLLVQMPACICFVESLFASTSLTLDVMYTFLIASGAYKLAQILLYAVVLLVEATSGEPVRQHWKQFWRELKMKWRGFFPDAKPTMSASAATAATTREKANSHNLASIPQFGELKPGPIAAKYTSTKHKCKMLQYFVQHCTVDGGKPATEDFIKARLVAKNIHDDHEGVRLCVMQEIQRVGLWGK